MKPSIDGSVGTDRQTLGIFWRMGLLYKPLLLQSLLFPTGILLSSAVAPLFISKTLGALAVVHGRPLHYLVIFAVTAMLGLLCNRIGHPAFMQHQATVARDIQRLVLSTLAKRSVGFYGNRVGGKLVSDAIDYTDAYTRLADAVFTSLLPLSITLVAGILIIYTESWQLGLFVTAMTAFVVGLGVRDSRRMAPRRQRRMTAGKAVTAHTADTITNIQTVKAFAHENRELDTHSRLSQDLATIRSQDWRELSLRGNTRLAVLLGLQIVLIYIVIHLVQQNTALLGIGIFAFTFTITLSNRLFEVNMLIRNIEESLLQASPMTGVIQESPEIQDKPHARPLRVEEGAIDVKDVTFAYKDDSTKTTIFSDLQLRIAPGEKVGLVGPSGGGKTTLTRLLLRFDELTTGEITVDGQNIADVTQQSLRQAVAYVPQEPLLFHRTIGENIGYGNPTADKHAVKQAACLAHADGFIGQLKDGYDTIVGERGVKLSGGQRQRVAIARAILKNAPILVLDEATSALDSESEALIQDALWKLMQGRTAVVVAHRLSTIQKMDRIIVLDGGRIIEQGAHRQLLKRKGLYAKLWAHQSGGFIES